MQIQIEPVRLREILSTALIAKGKPLLESVVAEFTPSHVSFKDVSLQEIAVYAVYLKKHFSRFEAETEDVPVSKFLLERLGWGFKKDEQIDFSSDGDFVVLTGKSEEEIYRERVPDLEKREFPIPMQSTPRGIIRKDSIPVEEKLMAMVQLPVSALSFPTADKYLFTSDGKSLRLTIEDEIGEYSKALKPSKVAKLSEFSIFFDAELWGYIVGNMSGEVWLGIHPDMAILSQRTEDSAITYMLSSREI